MPPDIYHLPPWSPPFFLFIQTGGKAGAGKTFVTHPRGSNSDRKLAAQGPSSIRDLEKSNFQIKRSCEVCVETPCSQQKQGIESSVASSAWRVPTAVVCSLPSPWVWVDGFGSLQWTWWLFYMALTPFTQLQLMSVSWKEGGNMLPICAVSHVLKVGPAA